MQCKCGAAMVAKESEKKSCDASLSFSECPKCKRVEFLLFKVNGEILERGHKSRDAFTQFSGESIQ
jgi:hypothetical protein